MLIQEMVRLEGSGALLVRELVLQGNGLRLLPDCLAAFRSKMCACVADICLDAWVCGCGYVFVYVCVWMWVRASGCVCGCVCEYVRDL